MSSPRTSALWPPILLIFAFAVFMLHGIGGAFPPGLNHDAAWHGLIALRILNGEGFGIYTPEAFGHEMPYFWVMAATFRTFGASKTSIELTATLFGALAVGLFYCVMRRKTGNSWSALNYSLLFVSSSALVLYSRVGWQLITLVPAALWVAASCRFYCDEDGQKSQKARFWAWQIGLSAGLTLYTYNGGRSILAFVPIFWLLRLTQTRFKRQTVQDAVISLGTFALVCAPMLFYAATHWTKWNGRALALLGNSGGLAGKIDNLKIALGYFNFSAHGDDFFTNFPVLEGPMLVLWAVGILFACARFRVYWPELLLFAAFLLPGVATQPSFHRAIGTLPVLYLLACYALDAIFRALQNRFENRALRPVWGIATALLIALQLGAGWKKLYIDAQPFAWGFYPETTVVGRYLNAHPTRKFALYAGNWPKDALSFLAKPGIETPGPGYENYQPYSTESGDGLPEIERDLANGTLPRPAFFVVDAGKIEAFSSGLAPHYRLKVEDEIKRDDAIVARVFRVD